MIRDLETPPKRPKNDPMHEWKTHGAREIFWEAKGTADEEKTEHES